METDVLAFPGGEQDGANPFLGEIVVSFETARAQAQRYRHSPEKEVALLLLHGLLHLLGYRDDTFAGAGKMHARELELLRGLGL